MRDHCLEGYTVRKYDGELNQLHLMVLEMGGLVQNQLQESLRVLKDLDVDRAHRIIKTDAKVDALELEVDEKVMALAARRAPPGRDLRLVPAVSKCVTEFEQTGDEAINIAKKTLHLCGFEGVAANRKLVQDIGHIANHAVELIAAAMKAYDLLEDEPAHDVMRKHRTLELNFQAELRRLVTFEVEDPRTVSQLVDIALIARSLEAIGHHAKKIAERVISIFGVKTFAIQMSRTGSLKAPAAAPTILCGG